MRETTRLLQALSKLAYQQRPDPFTLSSGAQSNEYLDCRAALSDPETLRLVASLVLGKIHRHVAALGGLTMGADPIAIATSLMSLDDRDVNDPKLGWFSVRKEPKKHGTRQLIEGSVVTGAKVAVVDDVATTGSSTIKAIQACQEQGLEVVQGVLLVDRGGVAAIRETGVPVSVLFDFDTVALVGRARTIATKAHDGQSYGHEPYTCHLEHTVSTVGSWIPYTDRTATLLAAAWLHDVPEDTTTTIEHLRAMFPEDVCDLVDACTDGDGKTRKEKKERPYTLIPKVRNSIVVKLADRLANVEAAISEIKDLSAPSSECPLSEVDRRRGILNMYRKEYPEFADRLRHSVTDFEDDVVMMWGHLEWLLFGQPV